MSDVDLLYEDAGSGRLAIGPDDRAVRVRDAAPQGPSVAGPAPRYGVGMGGSMASPAVAYKTRPVSPPPERHHTPEELMAMADAMEERQKAEYAARMAQGPAVKPEGPAPWLTEYMSKQPFTDPYHQVGPTLDESVRNNKYFKDDAERKKYLELLKRKK